MSTDWSARTGATVLLPHGSSRRRETWMDVVRGTSVLMVVLLHSVYVPADRGGLELPGWTDDVNTYLAPFRIPVLVMLSGMLLGPSLDKGWRRFFAGKLRQIAWPYLLWTVVRTALAGFLTVGLVWSSLRGGTYLWYLLFLLGYYALAWLLRPVPSTAVVAVALALAVAAPDDSKYLERLLYLFALFVLGDVVARTPQVWRWLTSSGWVPAVGAVLVLVHVLTGVAGSGYGPATLPGTLGGLLLGSAVARRVARWAPSAPLQFVGRQSLVYYVAHFPPMVVTTLVLVRLGVTDGLLVALVALVTGVALATVLAVTRRSPAVGWLFAFPGRQREHASAA